MTRFIYCSLLLFLVIACKQESPDLKGVYYNKYCDRQIQVIHFKDTVVSIVDQQGFVFDYQNKSIADTLIFHAPSDTIRREFKLVDDTLIIGKCYFDKILETDKGISNEVDLVDVEGRATFGAFSSKNRQIELSYKKNSDGVVELKKNSRVIEFEDLARLYECHGCKTRTEILLFADKNLKYNELVELYKWTSKTGIYKINFMTKVISPGVYEGFKDPIVVFYEDLDSTMLDSFSPLELGSKSDFIKDKKQIFHIANMNTNKLDFFRSNLDKGHSDIFVSFNHDMNLKEYVLTVTEMRKLIIENLNRISNIHLQKDYIDVDMESKRELSIFLPGILYERK